MFSDALKRMRNEKGLTQQKLASALGIATSTIGMYESGKREPNFDMCRRIEQFFGCSLSDLIDITPLEELPGEIEYLDSALRLINEHIIKTDGRYFLGEAGALSESEIEYLLKSVRDALNYSYNQIKNKRTMELNAGINNG